MFWRCSVANDGLITLERDASTLLSASISMTRAIFETPVRCSRRTSETFVAFPNVSFFSLDDTKGSVGQRMCSTQPRPSKWSTLEAPQETDNTNEERKTTATQHQEPGHRSGSVGVEVSETVTNSWSADAQSKDGRNTLSDGRRDPSVSILCWRTHV